jgi:hypothetical protein
MSDFQQPPPVNPYDSPETVRPGMSGAAKVLIGLGIGCGVIVLLCCGGFIFTGFWFTRSIQQAMSEDPATVRNVTDSMVTIDVPAELEPKMSMDHWRIPLVGEITMAIYGEPQQSVLALFQLDTDLGNAEQVKTQFEQSMREAGKGEMREVDLEESETFETEISGEKAEFRLGKGKRRDTADEVWQATGSFEGKGGAAILFMQLNAEEFDKDDALAILKSMK